MKLRLALFIVALGAPAWAAETVPALKAHTTVVSSLVRLGDVLHNAGAAAEVAVFHAPELGATGTIQTHRIIEAARANGVALLDPRGLDEVVVTRAARTVPLSDLERAVAEAAVRHLGESDIRDLTVEFDRDVRALRIEPDAVDAPRIGQFTYDSRTRRFAGTVEITGSAELRRHPARVSGTIAETAEVVTLVRPLARGETLRESDLVVERRPRAETAPDAIGEIALAVGQAARRALRSGQLLRVSDLMKPDLVGRNDPVMILFEARGVTLTVRGKALAAGAQGDVISVLNPQSKRVVQATVESPGVVVVGRAPETTASLR